jgi:hypothetical protein
MDYSDLRLNKGLYIGYGVLRTEHGVILREPGLCIDYPFMGRYPGAA